MFRTLFVIKKETKRENERKYCSCQYFNSTPTNQPNNQPTEQQPIKLKCIEIILIIMTIIIIIFS